MSGTKKPTTLVKTFLEAAKEIAPTLIRKCPYQGRIEAFDIKFPKKMTFMFPQGTYRIDLKAIDDASKKFIFMSLLMETD